MAFERHTARKRYAPPRRIATINGRPAWQVVDERRAAEREARCDPAPACSADKVNKIRSEGQTT